jgi:hypothetical protein
MHEKILQGVTVGVVAGLMVYWLTSKREYGSNATLPQDYKPTVGDVRTIRFGSPSCACCQCCGLVSPETTTAPLAADYLDGAPQYAPTVSKWNLGVSLQISCEGLELDSKIYRQETASAFPHTLAGPNTVARPVRVSQVISCSPDICAPICCTEVV